MSREEVYLFLDIVESIKRGEEPVTSLAPYTRREIAEAIEELIGSAKRVEREACAVLVDAAGEAAGTFSRGQMAEVDAAKRAWCLEIASRIRGRRN